MSKSIMKKEHGRIILHFDYDCFYASVFENENPALKSLPLAVQQKQIIVTCNYEARRRGLRKLQLISEARKVCPDVVIVLGEELGRFRDASKALYKCLEAFTWSGKVERLGFDEVFLDVTDIIDYNEGILNQNALEESFFQLDQKDPTVGFAFDATRLAGHGYPETKPPAPSLTSYNGVLMTRLILGSHLAHHLRRNLEEENGYTSTVGISTNKFLSKLVGNLNKPKGQTTLLPPYTVSELPPNQPDLVPESNVTTFLDGHDVGKIPGIGFKMSNLIRQHILSRPAAFDEAFIYGETRESITVRDVRLFPNMSPTLLESLLRGPGSEKGIGVKVWNLLHGIDPIDVQYAKNVPSQISIEDSYMRLDTMPQVLKELRALTTTLIKRMHTDLLEEAFDHDHPADDHEPPQPSLSKRWLAHPKTLRFSTRPRPRRSPTGEAAPRTFHRISHSTPLPNFVFNLKEGVDAIVERLVNECLVPMFKKLHPRTTGGGWDLSLLNVCVTGMVEAAREEGGRGGATGSGRDIGRMFRRQESVLREWRVEDRDVPPDDINGGCENGRAEMDRGGIEEGGAEPSAGCDALAADNTHIDTADELPRSTAREEDSDIWEDQIGDDGDGEGEKGNEPSAAAGGGGGAYSELCPSCGVIMPSFAMTAHERFHVLG